MVKKKGGKIIGMSCYNCHKFINPKKDHYVQLSTYNRSNSDDDHQYFHFSCWVEYFNKKVLEKAQKDIKQMQEQAIKIFDNPMIKNLLGQVQGSNIALNMLKMPLSHAVTKDIVAEKINNDRKKRSGKKRKAQMCKV